MAFEPKSAYAKKLMDPRWQKKRLEILHRDEFTCQFCGDAESTLHVHHKTYKWGNDPWDYPDHWLVTLCASCHEMETDGMKSVMVGLTQELKLTFDSVQLGELVVTINSLREFSGLDAASILRFHFGSPERYEKLREDYYAHLKSKKAGE